MVDQVIEVLHMANNFFETTKPWELRRTNDIQKLETVLCTTLETLRICGIILQPIIPKLSCHLLDKLCVDVQRRSWSDLDCVLWKNMTTPHHIHPMCNTNHISLGTQTDAILFKRIRLDSIEKQTVTVDKVNN